MEQAKRIKRSEATWRELFERQAASGVSLAEFCRNEGINPWLFRRWRSKLNANGQGAKRKRRAPARMAAPFIDIGAMDRVARSRFEVRLELGPGVVLNIAGS